MNEIKYYKYRPGLSVEAISKCEGAINVKFPVDFKNFYMSRNGGSPDPSGVYKDGEYYSVLDILPLRADPGSESVESMYINDVQEWDFFPKNLVPFAADAGGDYFCISVSGDDYGSIYLFAMDYYDDPERNLVHLANDFSSFIGAFVPPNDDGD
jgi:cell wall assembly regulator SMI1